MPRHANGAADSGRASTAIVADAACASTCFPDLNTATYSATGWQLSAQCGTCYREVPRKAWRSLSSQVDWTEL